MSLFKLIIITALLLFSFTLINTNNAQAQELTMFPGFGKYNFFIDQQKTKKDTVVQLMMEEPTARKEWKKSKKSNGLTWLMTGVETGFLALGTAMLFKEEQPSRQQVDLIKGGFLASIVGGGIFSFKSRKHKEKAILNYNESLDNKDMSILEEETK